jgi:hypothetical protein
LERVINPTTMNLEQQVCSLELAKRLKELGVKQDSLFYWHTGIVPQGLVTKEWVSERNVSASTYSAFTVAELGELLPRKITKGGWDYFLICTTGGKIKDIRYERDGESAHSLGEYTEADARAKMLIHLLENNLHQL